MPWVWVDDPDDDDEAPPTLGVREPRKPDAPIRSGGATADLHFEPEPEAEGIAQGARVIAA